jgi:hypothetical protein
LDSLRGAMLWNLHAPGTCSTSHSKKMELEKIGRLPVDSQKVAAAFPKRIVSGVSAAVQDISIANSMKSTAPCTAVPISEGTQKGRPRTLTAIEEIS